LVRHTFRPPNASYKPFDLVTIFDLVKDKAGVLIVPSFGDSESHRAFDTDTAFRAWKSQGQPTYGEALPFWNMNSGERVMVTVTQTEEMKQFVWFLRLEVLKD
jgi:hypothetical protein